MKKSSFILFLLLLLVTACRKEEKVRPQTPGSNLQIQFEYYVDTTPLQFDTMMYTNAAGNLYSVTRLQYYLSGIKFYLNNQVKYTIDTVMYLDAARQEYTTVTLNDIPVSEYDSISCNIGLDEKHNVSYSLPGTLENTNMEWPDIMGGGYHFLKLEGHWKNDTSISGYAMHIGTNQFLVKAGMKAYLTMQPGKTQKITLQMNINEWFENPYTYNLATDGTYSMGNAELMKKLAENGGKVFKIKH